MKSQFICSDLLRLWQIANFLLNFLDRIGRERVGEPDGKKLHQARSVPVRQVLTISPLFVWLHIWIMC